MQSRTVPRASDNDRFARIAQMAVVAIIVAFASATAHADDAWTVEVMQGDTGGATFQSAPAAVEARYLERLTLRDTVARALALNPALRAAYEEINARKGETYQASLRPNPNLLLEVENFAGSKDKQGFDVAEETASLTQIIELGDKRVKRLIAAELDTTLAGWDFEVVRMRVATLAAQAFVDVLTAQERVSALREFVSVAQKTRDSVQARVKVGNTSPIELDRASVALARANALIGAEEARLGAAKRKLSTIWGAAGTDFGSAAGRLGNGAAVPSVGTLLGYLASNPALARWSDEIGRRAAQVDIELAKSIPDLTFGAGVRRFNDNDSTALIASVSIPLPIFDRNEGNIAAAESRLAKAHAEAASQQNEFQRLLVEAVGDLDVAARQLTALKRDVLPVAQSAYDRTKAGFDQGKFDLLSVLDTQRSVFEVRLELLNARADYEKARVKVEALIGRSLF